MDEDIVVPIAFFTLILGIVALRVWRNLASERERQQTIRLAIERGQQLDAALVEKMLAPPTASAKQPPNPFAWPIGLMSAGLGLGAFSLFIRQLEETAFWPIMGSGFMIAVVGAGLFLSAWMRTRLYGPVGNGPAA